MTLLSWSTAVIIDSSLGRIIGEAVVLKVDLVNSFLQDGYNVVERAKTIRILWASVIRL
jgi:hypothetical protein